MHDSHVPKVIAFYGSTAAQKKGPLYSDALFNFKAFQT